MNESGRENGRELEKKVIKRDMSSESEKVLQSITILNVFFIISIATGVVVGLAWGSASGRGRCSVYCAWPGPCTATPAPSPSPHSLQARLAHSLRLSLLLTCQWEQNKYTLNLYYNSFTSQYFLRLRKSCAGRWNRTWP